MTDPDQTVYAFDPPRPVILRSYGGKPPGLLLRWEWRYSGWKVEWVGVVRFERDGKTCEASVPQYYLDVDPAEYPFVIDWGEPPPPPSHEPETCPYCRHDGR